MRFQDLAGNTYGRLIVIKRTVGKKPTWLCRCLCGKEHVATSVHLKNGSVSSCGCYSKEVHSARMKVAKLNIKAKGVSGFNCLVTQYKYGARKRGIPFELSKDEFKEFTTGDCHYCGVAPYQVRINFNPRQTENALNHTGYTYNGVDRINSDKPYAVSNCVSCCGICNKAKGEKSYDEFINWIDRLIEFKRTSIMKIV